MERLRQLIHVAATANVVLVLLCSCSGSEDGVGPTDPLPVASVELTPASVQLLPRDQAQLTATARDVRGNVVRGIPFVWSSSESAIASVAADGLVTAHVVGDAKITARSGSVEGSAEILVAIPPRFDLNATTSHEFQKADQHINRGALTRGISWASALVYHDFTGDGHTDVLMSRTATISDSPEPAQLMINDGSGRGEGTHLIEGPVFPEASLVGARKAIQGDYNGDGERDVFFLTQGWEGPPIPFLESPALLLGTGGGGFQGGQDFSWLVGFFHGGASADVDGDQDLDILLADGGPRMRLLLNDGTGLFRLASRLVPPEPLFEGMFTAEVFDLDLDGFADVLTAGHEFEGFDTQVLWGGEDGWSLQRRTVLPAVSGLGIVVDIDVADLDGDGSYDLVLNRVTDTPFYGIGYGVQVLLQSASRQFVDGWSTHDPNDYWSDWIRLQDCDGDALVDIIVDDLQWGRVWQNDGSGHFQVYDVLSTPCTFG